MKKKLAAALLVSGLFLGGIAAFAVAGSLQDPLVSLAHLKGDFQASLLAEVGQKAETAVGQSYQTALTRLEEETTRIRAGLTTKTSDGVEAYYQSFTPMTLHYGDVLTLSPGAGALLLEGNVAALAQGGELIDVTTGSAATSVQLIEKHRYLAGEGAQVRLRVQSESALLSPVAQVEKTTAGETSLPFTDITRDAWYYSAVSFAVEEKLLNGLSETRFAPDETVTRAMLATILHRLAKEPTGQGSAFSDVPTDAWFYKGVSWAAQTGIVKGMGEGIFQPNAALSREQLALMLYRYATQYEKLATETKGDISTFVDQAAVSDWARDGLAWALAAGIVKGDTTGHLNPKTSASRAEAATMLQRFAALLP